MLFVSSIKMLKDVLCTELTSSHDLGLLPLVFAKPLGLSQYGFFCIAFSLFLVLINF